MNYFKDARGVVHAYDLEQLEIGYPREPMTPMSEQEVALHLNPPLTPEQQEAVWKAERERAVNAITVTTASGKTFDGDEISQGRMARAILALQATPDITTTPWVMADNQTQSVTAAELAEALALAGTRQTELWIKP